MNLTEKHECSEDGECNSECFKWWMIAASAVGSSILTLIIVFLLIWIYFKCCTKEKRSKRKMSKKQQNCLVSDRPPGTAVLDLSDKHDKKTSPPHPIRRRRSFTPTSIYDCRKSYEATETTNQNHVCKNLRTSGEKMEEIFEPAAVDEIFQPQNLRSKPSKQSTMDLLKSDLFDRPSPNVYPKK